MVKRYLFGNIEAWLTVSFVLLGVLAASLLVSNPVDASEPYAGLIVKGNRSPAPGDADLQTRPKLKTAKSQSIGYDEGTGALDSSSRVSSQATYTDTPKSLARTRSQGNGGPRCSQAVGVCLL